MQEHEQRIIDVLENDPFIFNSLEQDDYQLVMVGKPIVFGGGECKTDVYALYESCTQPGVKMELKISAKKENAKFLENKVSAAKANDLLGANWQELLIPAIPLAFEHSPIDGFYSPHAHRNTEAGSLLLGYRLDLMLASGSRSFPLITTYKEKLLVLSGRDEYASILSPEKTNPSVNGIVIPNAGCADFIFVGNDYPTSAQEIFNELIPIENYAYQMGDIYGALKACNFRFWKNKFEDRPLAVYVNWFINENGMLDATLGADDPLMYKASDVKNALDECLSALGVVTPDDLVPGVTISPDIVIDY